VNQSVWTRLDSIARSLSPFTLTLLLVMAGMVPLRVPDFAQIVPSMGLIAVYYWVIHRPDLMPAWVVFLLGLLLDLIGGGPLGINVLVLLVVHGAVGAQQRFFASGALMLLWLVFVPVAAGAFFLTWLFNVILIGGMIDPGAAFFQYLATVAFYPCIAWLFAQAQRAFLK
jgi:rod shape-determining protein MreD